MNGKKSTKNTNRSNNRRRGDTKVMLWWKLAAIGIVPDIDMTRAQLKRVVQVAYAFLPGGSIGDGNPNTYPEIFGSMLRAHGYVKNDAAEAINLIWGTGRAFHYLQIPDLDPRKENRAEKKEAASYGKDYATIYKAVAKARKISRTEKKEAKKGDSWRETMT